MAELRDTLEAAGDDQASFHAVEVYEVGVSAAEGVAAEALLLEGPLLLHPAHRGGVVLWRGWIWWAGFDGSEWLHWIIVGRRSRYSE